MRQRDGRIGAELIQDLSDSPRFFRLSHDPSAGRGYSTSGTLSPCEAACDRQVEGDPW